MLSNLNYIYWNYRSSLFAELQNDQTSVTIFRHLFLLDNTGPDHFAALREKKKYFTIMQKAARRDIERAFHILLQFCSFLIKRGPE
ncbi:hypothetical protein BC938DRAFT_480605 [Jimgerdemannia flammicorona]|uniref:Uncharacterized protein n=1 Tax=Jimgerdemannia flammicorona TaxID=994334 RepID=A0A433QI67_9FUNG|nr:hypothetical protein BC938DRAFT_480605 [Jimgerdemannia flammicorona]